MEVLSTLQLVARLLQMKTQSRTHTYRHRDTHTHFQTSAQQPQSYSPVPGPLNFRVQKLRERQQGREGSNPMESP